MKNIFLAIFFFYTFSTSAGAEGFYSALDFGRTTAQDACSTKGFPSGTTVSGCTDKASLRRIAGGYQFNSNWGAELSFGNYGNAKLGTIAVPGYYPLNAGSWDLRGVQVSGIGTFPVNEVFSIIGKIGVARTTIKIADSSGSISAISSRASFGIGAQYFFNNNLSIRTQYENLGVVGEVSTTGTAKVSLISAGIVWNF